jgi:hypothetical protein
MTHKQHTNKRAPSLYVDQFGNRFMAHTVKELRKLIGNGGSRVSCMYQDAKDGTTYKVGYVIGQHWLTRFEQSRERMN